jgi:hypothetical protein
MEKNCNCGENMISGTRICGKCGQRGPANEMRYSVDGQRIICSKCQAIEKGGEGDSQRFKTMTDGQAPGKQASGAVNYFCTNCRFKFSRKREIDVSVCPYCSKPTISVVPSQNAQSFINKAGQEDE